VTGASSFKAGYIGNKLGDLRSANRGPNDLRYRVNNGVPNQLTQYVHEQQNDLWMRNHAFYAQEQWTRGRLTLQGALALRSARRAWRRRSGSSRASGRSRWCSTRRRSSDSYNDLTPRAAVTYDLFGNGKTALKATLRQVPRVHGHRLELRPAATRRRALPPTSRARGPTATATGTLTATSAIRRRRTSVRTATSAAPSAT
jgi:hypothetical protein